MYPKKNPRVTIKFRPIKYTRIFINLHLSVSHSILLSACVKPKVQSFWLTKPTQPKSAGLPGTLIHHSIQIYPILTHNPPIFYILPIDPNITPTFIIPFDLALITHQTHQHNPNCHSYPESFL